MSSSIEFLYAFISLYSKCKKFSLCSLTYLERYGKRLMDTGAAMRWKSLPNELKCAITTNCFK